MNMADPVALAQALIRRPSVTPVDAGALDVAQEALERLGFTCRRLVFSEDGFADIDNLYARIGQRGPNFCFAGHTDVVPPGDPALWEHDPFGAEIVDGRLYGRGACDMKSAVAAFIAAAGRFLDARGRDFGGSISLLLTGDEEADAVNGTRKVLDWLARNGERLDACLVGEPTCTTVLGDVMKIGRRGSMTGYLKVTGTQGHVAYPALADNPLPRLVRMLDAITREPLDAGTEHFDPSSLQITTIDVGNRATNVIPAEGRAVFNIRFNDRHDSATLERWLRDRLDAVGEDYELQIRVSGESFLTPPGALSDAVAAAIERTTGRRPAFDTGGGTSDARFIKDHCPVVEFGLVNRTIHKANEHVETADIERLSRIYQGVLDEWFDRHGE